MRKSKTKTQQVVSREVQSYFRLSRRYGWRSAVIGKGPKPTDHVWTGDWLLIPWHLDNTELPKRAIRRVQQIFAEGLLPKGFVIVHEAPKMLRAGPTQPSKIPTYTTENPIEFEEGRSGINSLGSLFSKIAGSLLLFPLTLFSVALIIDPILVVVTQDDVWIEIDRWDTEVEER